MDVILYTSQGPICWPLGRTVKERFQNRHGCKMRAFICPWLVLRLADII